MIHTLDRFRVQLSLERAFAFCLVNVFSQGAGKKVETDCKIALEMLVTECDFLHFLKNGFTDGVVGFEETHHFASSSSSF